MQCACAILSSEASLALQHFSALFHKWYHFRKKTLNNIKCVIWFSLHILSETFLILRGTKGDFIKNVYWSSCKINFLYVFSKNSQTSKAPRKSVQWEPRCSMRAGGRTDRYDEAIAACRNFSNAPKDSTFCPHSEFICVLNGSQNKQRLFPYTALTD